MIQGQEWGSSYAGTEKQAYLTSSDFLFTRYQTATSSTSYLNPSRDLGQALCFVNSLCISCMNLIPFLDS